MGIRRRTATAVVACLAAGLVGGVAGGTGTTAPATAALRPCSNGLVALTFDDGPSTRVTGQLLDVLVDRRVPATFFVVGERVAAAEHLSRRAFRHGYVIANHTYRHEQLTSLSNDAIRSTLGRTAALLREIGVRPSPLMRPPYGLTDARVRSVVTGMGLTEVLWDVDSRNWEPATPAELTIRVLSALRPGRRNVVLLHDGVTRSTTTLAAVPGIVTGARERGYCFAELGPDGAPAAPVPVARVSDARVEEAGPGQQSVLRFVVRLDRPTSVPVSLRARTDPGTARPDLDFTPLRDRVVIPSGSVATVVDVTVRGDRVDETRERLRLLLAEPRGLVLVDRQGFGTIDDDDPRPRVHVVGSEVVEPRDGSVFVDVPVTISRPSSRVVRLLLATAPAEADEADYVPWEGRVVLMPGERRTSVSVEVLSDDLVEPAESFEVVVVSARGARPPTTGATVTIAPPEPE